MSLKVNVETWSTGLDSALRCLCLATGRWLPTSHATFPLLWRSALTNSRCFTKTNIKTGTSPGCGRLVQLNSSHCSWQQSNINSSWTYSKRLFACFLTKQMCWRSRKSSKRRVFQRITWFQRSSTCASRTQSFFSRRRRSPSSSPLRKFKSI